MYAIRSYYVNYEKDVKHKPLEEYIISLKTGLNPRKNFALNTDDATNYYVTVREIVNGKIVFFDKTDKVSDKALKLINNRSNLEAGDILFSGTGTVGRTVITSYSIHYTKLYERRAIFCFQEQEQSVELP